jgi:hypothetical protein
VKKVKITINEGSIGRTLPVFADQESAYVWLHEAVNLDEIDGVDQVALMPGEFIEAEWRGCEFVYDKSTQVRLDLCRFAKASKPENSSGLVVSIHYGWVADCIIPFHDYKDEDINVQVMLWPGQLDLPTLFKDTDDIK